MEASLPKSELLKSMPIFGGINRAALELILGESEEVEFDEGYYFFREGAIGENVFVLASGTALVERNWEDTPIILARFRSGDCFGEMSLIDLQRRAASVKAESAGRAIKIPYQAFQKLCQNDITQYTMIMMNLGREVSRRLRIAGDRLFRYQQELGQHWFGDDFTGDG